MDGDDRDPDAAPATGRPLRGPSRGRAWRRAGIGVVFAVLAWSAAWFYLPPLVASQARNAVQSQLGRKLSIGAVVFNPWTLELTLSDLAMAAQPSAAADAAPPLLRIKRLRADIAVSSLWRFAPVVDAVDIDAPQLRVARRADGRLDIDDILQRLASRPADAAGHDAPARFAVHNIVVRGGAIDWADAAAGSGTRRVRDLELGVPFLSTLESAREVKVEPRLAFTLDGSRFDSAAAATPFAERGNGEATLTVDRFDLAPWLGYLPASLPVRVRSALLSADLRFAFEQRPKLSLRISGSVGLADVKVADVASARLADVGSIKVEIDELRPLEATAAITRVEVDAPSVLAVRDSRGRVNLLLAAEGAGGETPVAKLPLPTATPVAASALASASSSAVAGASAVSAPPAAPVRWKATLAELSVRAGSLEWQDATTRPAARITVADFSLDAKAVAWPFDAPVEFSGSGRLTASAAAAASASTAAPSGRVTFSGRGDATEATVKVGIESLSLALVQPYLHDVLALPLAGQLSADLDAQWRASNAAPRAAASASASASASATSSPLRLTARRLALTKLTFGDARAPELAAEAVEIGDATLDLGGRSARIGRVALTAPRLRALRDRDRHWNFERWRSGPAPAALAGAASAPAVSTSASASAAPSPGAPWQLALGTLDIADGRLALGDATTGRSVAIDVSQLAVQLSRYALDAAEPAAFHVSARLAVASDPAAAAAATPGVAGNLDLRGELKGLAGGLPSSLTATVVATDLPLHLADPYLDGLLDVDVARARGSWKGEFAWEQRPAGAALRLRGDGSIDDFRATSVAGAASAPRRALTLLPADGGASAAAGRQLLNWKSLALRGVDVALAPGAATRVSVDETLLTDFFARVVLDESGRLNLQDVVRRAEPAATPASASAAGSSAAASSPAAIVRFGPITVAGGRVNFNDRFVRPNYTANLSELSGRLASFTSEPAAPGAGPTLAELALTGRVEGTASLEVAGKVNPLAKPLALDLKAKVRDLELPPLSPYSIKYAGYGIERGKLSVDLAYVVQPNGQLTANNRIVLNQLAFGDKVEGAPASLPVKLAVALLADRNGVIDLDLPVGGSINDPQFSVGGLVWQALKNILVKAITAPFSLLASAFGGGGNSTFSSVEFEPGTATLTPASRDALDKIAAALAERPALSLTVSGESRMDVERDAWKADRLRQIVRSEKRRQAVAGGAAANADITVSDAEYPALLKQVYARADVPKPKTPVGLAKELPAAEMEQVLLAGIVVADDAMQQLAVRRGVAVRDYLAAKNLPTSRLFLGAPKTAAAGADDANWAPRADLKLTAA